MFIEGTFIDDTYAEAFTMWASRLIITAVSEKWAAMAAQEATGYGTSIIGCDAEAGIERELSPHETPDGRPGVSVLFFARTRERLEKAVGNRVGQAVLTCPTTACWNGLPEATDRIRLGAYVRFFGDGFEKPDTVRTGAFTKQRLEPERDEHRKVWRIPVMDGEFLCEEYAGAVKAVAGGNFFILARSLEDALAAAERASKAVAQVPSVITPFPGGVVRAGSKVGSTKYRFLKASTNHPYCPTLKCLGHSALPAEVAAVYEIVIDGLTLDAVKAAMREGIEAACGKGVLRISAGNYGGRLGNIQIRLRELFGEETG